MSMSPSLAPSLDATPTSASRRRPDNCVFIVGGNIDNDEDRRSRSTAVRHRLAPASRGTVARDRDGRAAPMHGTEPATWRRCVGPQR
uniref:Uncharacterized protein n=1 Tax=Oryza meridionalis TaxID=40149 RepID=A0A0E0EPH8_9ORYZ